MSTPPRFCRLFTWSLAALVALGGGPRSLLADFGDPDDDPRRRPPPGDQPLYAYQDLFLDVLPVAVIYEPPGEKGKQSLKITDRFSTRTTIATMDTGGVSSTLGIKLEFVSGSHTEENSWSYNHQTSSWTTKVNTSGWETWARQFPGSGDVIAFLLRPQFRVTWYVGRYDAVNDRVTQVLPQPIFVNMKPVYEPPSGDPAQDTWIRRAATVHEISSGIHNGQGLSEAVRDKLLVLDPFVYLPPAVEPAPGQPRSGCVNHFKRLVDGHCIIKAHPERFQFQSMEDWAPCGPGVQIAQQVQVGSSTSQTVTFKHTASTQLAASPTVPVGDIKVTPSITDQTRFSFEYSINRMTEESLTTDASSVLGGGSCPAGAGLSRTYIYYDRSFGTLVFPTISLPAANAEGLVLDRSGRPAPAQRVMVSREGDDLFLLATTTDAAGRYRLSLEPGRYAVAVESAARRRLSPYQGFEVAPGGPVLSLPSLVMIEDVTPAETVFARGDANASGVLDLSDSIFVLTYLFLGQEDPPCLKALDANDDGALDISDAAYSLGYLFLGGAAMPAPSSGCGVDVTPDDLRCESFAACGP